MRVWVQIMAPVVRQRKGEHAKVIERIRKEGYTRVRVDGEILSLDEDEIRLDKKFKHTIEIVVDRVIVREGQEGRLADLKDKITGNVVDDRDRKSVV